MQVKAESGRGVRSGSDEYRRLALSGGFLTLLMARELCNKGQRIDVYGMETNATDDCCRDMNRRYAYYQPQSHHKCCIRCACYKSACQRNKQGHNKTTDDRK